MSELETILSSIKEYNKKADLSIIKKAFNFSYKAHKGQKRLTGDEYFTHPLAVAQTLTDLKMDIDTIAAGFLHDTLEDTDFKKEDLKKNFGENIAFLVEGVTTLGKIDFSKIPGFLEDEDPKVKADIENLRKLFLAMAQDIRVVIIKLADRLHNMQTLDALPERRKLRNSRETLEVFAPLADRLGIGQLKKELEDMAFKYLLPEEYKNLKNQVKQSLKEKNKKMIMTKRIIKDLLIKEKVKYYLIDGRVKHLYSLYMKLQKVDGDLSKVYDLIALRVVVSSVADCYKTLGIIHQKFKPLIYRIKDYIAVPKPNGYQSLHTTVFGIKGEITEIQIRTKEMHQEAEFGVAAHWHYSSVKSTSAYIKGQASFAPKDKISWIKELIDVQKETRNVKDFVNALKIDIFNDRIFVFSPKGDLFNLPEGATPVDFAYSVHTSVGNQCVGAKVNGRIVNLDHKLSNRDVVEILTHKRSKGPSRKWLDFVVTSGAKQKIRAFFRKFNKESNIIEGRKDLEEELFLLNTSINDLDEKRLKDTLGELPYKNLDDFLAAVGEGFFTPSQFIKKYFKKDIMIKKKTLRPDAYMSGLNLKKIDNLDLKGIKMKKASCCLPGVKDRVVGYVTRGKGLTIHKASCRNVKNTSKERIINIDWQEDKKSGKIQTAVKIEAEDRIGLLKDISALISNANINIGNVKSFHHNKKSSIFMDLEVENIVELQRLMKKILVVKGVLGVKKVA